MENLTIEIKNLKNIQHCKISLPLKPGLYAITGQNGVGKSTIFSVLSKIVYTQALEKYFKGDNFIRSEIEYDIDGVKNTWTYNNGWHMSQTNTEEFKEAGFYEGSLIFGTRFADAQTSKIPRTSNIENTDLVAADDFIITHMGEILKNDPLFYSGLKKIRTIKRANELGFKGMQFVLEREGVRIFQYQMSSGEFLLLGLLNFIHSKIRSRKSKSSDAACLIFMDEIELALHPLAQRNLALFLNSICIKHNFCVYFATHSIQIINHVHAYKTYHIEDNGAGILYVANPCYPAYATKMLYGNDGYDFIFMVEDILAQSIVEKIIRDNRINESLMTKVVPCGGWENVLDLHEDFKKFRVAGESCKIISILDGDAKELYENKHKKSGRFKDLHKLFLPIQSIEKYLRYNMIETTNPPLMRRIEQAFYPTKTIKEIITSYNKNPSSAKDKTGKGFFSVLASCAEEQGTPYEVFKNSLVQIIFEFIDFTPLKENIERGISKGATNTA